MPNYEVRTNNEADMFNTKVELRLRSLMQLQKIKDLPEIAEPLVNLPVVVRVLDAYGGDGLIWKEVKKQLKNFPVKLMVLGIDKVKSPNKKRVQLFGENLNFLSGINLQYFDIIDLDAWGQPTKQLDVLRARAYTGTVHCTFSLTGRGSMAHDIYKACGYSEAMIKKCNMLLTRGGFRNFLQYLAVRHRVTFVTKAERERSHFKVNNSKKIYLFFIMTN